MAPYRALNHLRRAIKEAWERFLVRALQFAFALGFLIWFFINNSITRGK